MKRRSSRKQSHPYKGGNTRFSKAVRYRDRLAEYEGRLMTFRATVSSTSLTNYKTEGYRLETMELTGLYAWDTPEQLVADHVWVKLDDVQNREVVDALMAWKPELNPNVDRASVYMPSKRIVFEGIVYPYSEPFCGAGFRTFRSRYSIANIKILETRPPVMKAITESVA